ncbi:MAG TPA: Xaa-Pro peptidase family protein [Trueperaceae bacterium]|nr:Xaa-Pro peptidase family protein [Trueperaceae bacterium]
MSTPHAERQQAVMDALASLHADAFLTFDPDNRRYLSGFTGSAGHVVLTAGGGKYFVSDPRYTERAQREAAGFEVIETHVEKGPDLWGALTYVAERAGIRRLAFEAALVSVAWHAAATAALGGLALMPSEGVVERLRRTKDAAELAALRRAQAITDEVFAHILGHVVPGVSERDIAVELRHQIELRGARNYANLPIIASGARSAEGHAYATDKRVEAGDLVLMDFGAAVDGYYADMTRTVVCGPATPQQRAVHDLVQRAIADGLACVRAGATTFSVKKAGRTAILEAGYGDRIRPGLGHGIGLQVHEAPFMRNDVALFEGDVITFEPGIYLPGWGGVRIEDAVLVTADGCEPLPASPRELIETG